MTVTYYVDDHGRFLGAFDGGSQPAKAQEVPHAPDDARQIWDGEAWVDVPIRLTEYAADKRYAVETGGITVNGATVDTSRDSQAMITGAYAYSQANPSEMIQFKAASGWVTLDAATLAAIATAVGAHVQACFAVEATVAAEIEAGTITTTAEIDAADWPG